MLQREALGLQKHRDVPVPLVRIVLLLVEPLLQHTDPLRLGPKVRPELGDQRILLGEV